MPKHMVTSNIRHFPTCPMKCNSKRKTINYESAMIQKLRIQKHFKKDDINNTTVPKTAETEKVSSCLNRHSFVLFFHLFLLVGG